MLAGPRGGCGFTGSSSLGARVFTVAAAVSVPTTFPAMASSSAPLAGVRIIEGSMLGPGALTTHLADLGAEVIKVEPPQGDYVPRDDVAHRRGRVAAAPPHQPGQAQRRARPAHAEGVRDAFLELVRGADAVVEAMRPGGLERRGLGYERLREVNPRDRVLHDLGLRHDRPVHGHAEPRHRVRHVGRPGAARRSTDDGFAVHPRARVDRHPRRAAVRRARRPRRRSSGPAPPARAAGSRSRSPTPPPPSTGCAARRGRPTSGPSPRSPATSPTTTSAARPAPPACEDGVRYQFYETTDGHVLFMASRAGVLEELLRGRRPARPVRALARARSTPTTPSATSSCARAARHLRARARRPSGSSSATEHNTPIAPVEHAADAGRRPAVPGPASVDPAGRGWAPTAADADQVRRRRAAGADEGADRRPAHRDRAARRARLDRCADRRGAGERRIRDRVRVAQTTRVYARRRVRDRTPAP